MASNTLAITALGKDKVSGPMRKAAKSFVQAQKDAENADKKLTKVEKIKAAALKASARAYRIAGKAAKGMAGAALAGIAAFTAAAAGIWKMARSSADAGDAAFVMSKRVGASTEFLTQMGFAARQNGSSMGAVEKALGKLSKNALSGSISFKRWGVSARDANGNIKDSETLYRDVTKRIAGMTSPTERAAAAQELLGKSGLELLPLIEGGADALDEMANKADRLGITISTTDAIIANEFNNQLGATQDALAGAARVAGSVFLPVLTDALTIAQEKAGELTGEVRKNQKTLEDYARGALVAVIKGFASLVRGIAFVVRGVDGIRVALKFLSVIQAQTFLAMAEGVQSAIKPMSALLDAMVKLKVIDLNPLSGALDDVTSVLREVADDAQRELDLSIAGTLARQRGFEAAAAQIDNFGDKLANMATTEKRLASDRAADAAKSDQRHGKNILNIEEDKKAAISAAKEKAKADKLAIKEALAAKKLALKEETAVKKLATQADKERVAATKSQAGEVDDVQKEIVAKAEAAASFTLGLFTSSFDGVIQGTKRLDQAFGQLFINLGKKLLESVALKILTGIFGFILGGVGGIGSLITGIAGTAGLNFKQGGVLPGYAQGGIIGGAPTPGRDSVLVAAQPGEGFLPVQAVRMLRRILGVRTSSESTQQFQRGGVVSAAAAGITFILQPSVTAGTLNTAAADRYGAEELLPMLRRLKDTGQLAAAMGTL